MRRSSSTPTSRCCRSSRSIAALRQGARSVRGRPGPRANDARRTGTLSARPSCDPSTVRCGIRANTPPRPASGVSRSPDPDNKRPNQTKNDAKTLLCQALDVWPRSTFSCRSQRVRDARLSTARGRRSCRGAGGARRRVAPTRRAEARPAQLGWLLFWMSGTLTAFIVAALSVRALSHTLNAFEMMTIRSAGGLVILLAMGLASPGLAAQHQPGATCACRSRATSCISDRRSAGPSRSRCCRSRPCSRSNSSFRPGSRCSPCCFSASA